MKRAEEQVQQSLRMLTIIREVQERLKKNDSAAAARLRDTRLVALLAGVGFREMRLIDETFLEDYLADALEEQESFKGRVDAILNEQPSEDGEEIPGLDILDSEDPAASPSERSSAPLLMLLAETAGQENITLRNPSEGNVTIPRGRFVGDLTAAVDSAAEDARVDREKGDLLDRPLLFVRKALRHLN